ncbi:MAG: TRAP transporter small permease [bacterium]|nr:TRAP transporter small permease [bacterium]
MLVFRVLRAAIEGINRAAALVSGLALLVIGCMVFAEVILRAGGRPSEWLPEWSGYLFSWAMVGGAAYTLMRDRHVRVELLQMHLPASVNRVLNFCTALAGAAFCVLVAMSGWEHFQDALLTGETTATTLRVPLWIIEFPVFLSFALLALQFLIEACKALFGFRRDMQNTATDSTNVQLSKESNHA